MHDILGQDFFPGEGSQLSQRRGGSTPIFIASMVTMTLPSSYANGSQCLCAPATATGLPFCEDDDQLLQPQLIYFVTTEWT